MGHFGAPGGACETRRTGSANGGGVPEFVEEKHSVAGVRNLTQDEAVERARLLNVDGYDIVLDLTDGTGGPGEATFRSTTTVTFGCAEPGNGTFIEVAAERIRSATLNGVPVDVSGWSSERGLALTGLAAENVLVVDADFGYSSSGQGLHRSVDPVDKEVYLYSQFETADATSSRCSPGT